MTLDYYPFGLKQKGYNNTVSSNGNALAQQWKFNGMEFNEDLGINMYDFGARNYMPDLGRWGNIDPLSDKYVALSPYNYTANNPIYFVDPDGRKIIISANTRKAVTDLTKIAITSKGQVRINALIKSNSEYEVKNAFFTTNSEFEVSPYGHKSITYAQSPWYSTWDGGSVSSTVLAGHEIDHAYDYNRGRRSNNRYKGVKERGAVHFGNYLRNVYGSNDMRTYYSGASGRGSSYSNNPRIYNPKQEKITDFMEIDNISIDAEDSGEIFGYSYAQGDSDSETSTNYVIGIKLNKDDSFHFVKFDNKEDYDERIKLIQTEKDKENEK